AALTSDDHVGEVYEVTGPRLITFAEAVGEIAKASGREIAYISIPNEAFRAGLEAAGMPEQQVGLLDYLFSTVLDGRNAHVTDGVERALGRPARDFSDYARSVAKTGVWNA
ncbi:MAG: NmrA family transcriptional regulator, partial [Planctomycetota bacterium]